MKKNGIKIIVGTILVIATLGILRFHPWNISKTTDPSHTGPNTEAKQSLTIGYLPVTCHLTCPVTDFASKTTVSNTNFNSLRFSDFPTVASALEAKQLMATFMIAPLAMKLCQDGVPVKICYLGHRDGSEIIIAKNNTAKNLADMKGKTIAVPSLYSNQNLVIHKLMADQGMQENDINIVVLPPPDMPTSLASGAIDGYFVGEPFCAKAEMEKVGRVLYYSSDIWPNFISCVLVVHEDLIRDRPDVVRDLVRGIAASGKWAEDHRSDAATLVAPYYRQDEKVLDYVLNDPHRVSYVNLTPTDEDFEQIQNMALSMGVLKKKLPISDYLDRDFIPDTIIAAPIDIKKVPAK